MAVPFGFAQHLVVVPVSVDGTEARFVLDTGIGLPIVSPSFCRADGGVTYTGRRMSGQAVTVPLGRLSSLVVDSFGFEDLQVGVLDLAGADGFLSLGLFHAFTVDYGRRRFAVETPGGLESRAARGTVVSVEVRWDGPAASPLMPLTLPSGREIVVEVDMGSDALILDERFREEVEAGPLREERGRDETGHRYVRRFGTLRGSIHPAGAPEVAVADPPVMFQSIIYDGLVGHSFLKNFVVSYDVDGGRIIFGPGRPRPL